MGRVPRTVRELSGNFTVSGVWSPAYGVSNFLVVQVEKIARRVDTLKVDGLMQNLKKEVEAVSHLTRCMDAFTNNHTRLVVIVDGLDSCEQDKLLQVLDMVCLLSVSIEILTGAEGNIEK